MQVSKTLRTGFNSLRPCQNHVGEIMWKVAIIESERGWGSKVDEVKSFDTYEAAIEFQKKFNAPNDEDYAKTGKVPDWYMQAEDPYRVKHH